MTEPTLTENVNPWYWLIILGVFGILWAVGQYRNRKDK